ncbi:MULTISPECIES: DUF305 domain-containing protein [Calothrix]|uniref:DUF305 domain-containing protein n=2 Tax=Calothrix TaxID=1186 RepID=A0ABR8A6R2_9CYAN|nr:MULTISPECIES: DUF305 domain-containing protein [Calothrix]MBD2194512.1 DUF305 domain-containing protein [Calothrix parietina FACHB-288]MBD2223382.1 DUF305 domain-containing protein [Calothrix anomala FACHB-343]
MKTDKLFYSLAGLLASSAISGLLVFNNAQAQVSNSEHNNHQQSTEANPPKGMMGQIDQHFMEKMIPHHTQALETAEMALSRAQHPEIKKLALAIKQDQNREILQMKSWYKAWYGKDLPATGTNHQNMQPKPEGTGEQAQSMKCKMRGMKIDLVALKNAPDFDKEFIQQMVPHHRMAVKMAQMASKKSTKSEIKNLAESIIKTQTAEIQQMEQWYQDWYKSKVE